MKREERRRCGSRQGEFVWEWWGGTRVRPAHLASERGRVSRIVARWRGRTDRHTKVTFSARVRSELTRQHVKLERNTRSRSTMSGRIPHQRHRKDTQSAHELLSLCTSLQLRAAGLSWRIGWQGIAIRTSRRARRALQTILSTLGLDLTVFEFVSGGAAQQASLSDQCCSSRRQHESASRAREARRQVWTS
ncbi:hypothetical protein BD311DRAFT_282980 [Dichomitus squalens]|uniref:Uncharacterized protein n=1 Tax=Dichomitus squalens TaxID=114155 RepID=A0A4Q9N1V3_9APHY|nr:hypothetical protein BD311DRAFT_282980 [Dichomitus squalens]